MTDLAEGTETEVARLSRVSVVCGGAQVDVSLPLQTPTEVLIPELIRLFGDRISGSAESAWARPWLLAPLGRDPLPGPQTPADAGITEGDLLVLFVADAPPPPTVFDDVFDTTAADLAARARWNERAAAIVGLIVLGAATVATAAVSLRLGLRGDVFALLWTAGGAMLLLVGAGVAVRRMRVPGAAPTALAGGATVLAATAGALAVPLGPGGGYGAANGLLAVVAAAVTAVVALRITAQGVVVHIGVVTAACIAGPALFALLWLPDRRAAVAATVAVVAYVVIAFGARIGAAAARLPLPRVPAAGERIDPIDDEPPPTVAGVGAVATGLTDETVAAPRAGYAQLVCTGVTVGAAVAGSVAALVVGAGARELPAQHIAFAAVIAVAYCLRGRTHGDPVQAGATILGGAAVAIGTATSLAWGYGPWPVLGLITLAAIAALALACGVAAPRITFSPVQRRAAELGEYLTIAAAGPLLGWVWDVYSTVRNL